MAGPYQFSVAKFRSYIQSLPEVRHPPQLPGRGERLTREQLSNEVAAILKGKLGTESADGDREIARWAKPSKKKRKGRTFDLSEEVLDSIAVRVHQYASADLSILPRRPRDLWERWIEGERVWPQPKLETEPSPSPELSGEERAERGEIWVMEPGPNLIRKEHGYTYKLVAVSVDNVRFLQIPRGQDAPSVRDGNYVRIEVPTGKHGSVGLFVDLARAEVVLTAQWRHPQKRFLIETPRGFPAPEDKSPFDTIRREGAEETAREIDPNKLHFLRELYTDTGKLSDCPCYYLGYVDRERYDDTMIYKRDPIVAPIWVPLNDFYEAVLTGEEVELEENPFDDTWLQRHRRHMMHLRESIGTRLKIEDSFTVTAAYLAIPRLRFMTAFRSLPCWRHLGIQR